MSFFTTSDNQQIEQQGKFELGGGDFDPIPRNTQLKSMITEAKWDEYEGERYISATWSVIEGEYKNRNIFQKIKVLNPDPKKADKQKLMLAAIDSNCGGKLMQAGVEPDDMALAINLVNKPMMILVDVWKIEEKQGNWIKSVAPCGVQQTQPQTQTKPDSELKF